MKCKILFLMPAMLDGGAEKVLIDILNHFDYSKYNVTLLLECKNGPYVNDISKHVKLIYIHNKSIWLERLVRFLILLHCRWIVDWVFYRLPLLWYLRGMHYDTIISFMEGMAVKMHSYLFAKADRNISWVHIDLKKKHWSLEFFNSVDEEYETYKRMNKIVFVSNDAKNRFKEIFDISDEKLEVLYNIIDSNNIVKSADLREIKKRRFTICMLGRLNDQKRYDKAIEVAYRLKKEGYDLDFWILGAGELEKELKQKVYDFGLTDSFLFLGFVKPPYSYLKYADMLLICSDSEGFSLVICEAFCLGKPVVSTKTAGPTELIQMSEAGVLVDSDIDSIFEGVKRMIDDKGLRHACAEKALMFSKSFDVQNTMKKLYQLL